MTSHLTSIAKTLSNQSAPPVAYERSVVFTDVVDSTLLVDRMGDECLLSVIVHHHQLAVELGAVLGAEQISSTGDGVFAVFEEADDALEFASRMVAGMRDASLGGACPATRLHVGVASGPVHHWNGDYFGRTMHRAARICREARPNEILVDADTAAELVEARALLAAGREVELRGFAATETIHQVDAREAAAGSLLLAAAG